MQIGRQIRAELGVQALSQLERQLFQDQSTPEAHVRGFGQRLGLVVAEDHPDASYRQGCNKPRLAEVSA